MSIKSTRKSKTATKVSPQYLKHGAANSQETKDLFQELHGGPLNLGRALGAIRQSDEITRAEFARALGIPRQHCKDIEKGRHSVSLKNAAKFVAALSHHESVFVRIVLQSVDDMTVEIAS